MVKINSVSDLAEAIAMLEEKQQLEGKILKAHFHRTFESLKPVHLIESAIHGVVTSSKIREDVVTGSISLAAGYAAKRIVTGKSQGPVRNILGTVAELGVANMIAQNPKAVKTGFEVLKILLGGSKSKKAQKPANNTTSL